MRRLIVVIVLGFAAVPRAARAQTATDPVAFIASFLPSHARVRRDTFDDATWGGGDYYVKAIARAQGDNCAVELYTRGDGSDYRVRVDFTDSLLVDQQHGPEGVTLQAIANRPAIQSWHVKWDGRTPKLLDAAPSTLVSLLLHVSNPEAGDRLAEAARRALALCGGHQSH